MTRAMDKFRFFGSTSPVKLTLQIQLLPDHRQAAAMRRTIRVFNEAANWLANEAFNRKTANKILLQKLYYKPLRVQFGLSAQMAVRCIAQACEACKRDKSIRPRFRNYAAMPLDQRLMGFKGVDRVSIRTLEGRVIVPMVMGAYQQERFSLAKGQSDLVLRRDGKWFLLVSVELPDGTPVPTTDFVGVDLGVTNLATDSDGNQHRGAKVEATRQRYFRLRQSLQKAGSQQKNRGRRPKNIRRKLKRISRRESRFRRDVNHRISKELVVKAKDTSRGIALENLKGIRERSKRFRKPQRARLAGWSFFQLRSFIEYKARMAGVEVVVVDPAYTSQTCSQCGHTARANRKSQAEFVCVSCGHTQNADFNAAINIARAAVNRRKVAESAQAA